MTYRTLAAILALLIIQGLASAQTYAIRITQPTNLRASHSLQSPIAEIAPAGAILNVIGKRGRWLNINRNDRDLWMADWVDHTRVDSSQSQPSSSADNCCGIDRQCDTDQQWTDGYWAFQRRQCPAPQQNQSAPQPPSAPPSQANNCCFLGWQCHSDQDWRNGYIAYEIYPKQCRHPGIALQGKPGFIKQMVDALDLLKNRVPHWYDYTIRGLDRIIQNLNWQSSGVIALTKTFYLNYGDEPPAGFTYDSHTTVSAGILVHEACHVHQHQRGFVERSGYDAEKECLQKQLQSLSEINPGNHRIPYYRSLLACIHEPRCQWWR